MTALFIYVYKQYPLQSDKPVRISSYRLEVPAGAVVVAAHHDEEDDEHEEESPGDSVHDGGGEGDRDGVVRHGRATMLLVTSAPVSSYN